MPSAHLQRPLMEGDKLTQSVQQQSMHPLLAPTVSFESTGQGHGHGHRSLSKSLSDPSGDEYDASQQQHLSVQRFDHALIRTPSNRLNRQSTRGKQRRDKELQNRRTLHAMSDVKTLLTYTKCFLIAAYFVFICGSGITLNDMFEFLIDDYENSDWITCMVLLGLGAISLVGLWGAYKEDSCVLLIYGTVILIVFFLHVILLFMLKNACTDTQRKCYRNMATPPGLAPILVAISELAISMTAFFMALVIESEKKRHQPLRLAMDPV